MNRTQLDAMLTAGLITAAQHSTALTLRTTRGTIPAPTLELHIAALAVTDPAADSRIITGTIAVYGELIRSHGMILHTGSLIPREPLSRVKMLRDHNMADPVGFMATLDPATLAATFQIPEGAGGDLALEQAANGLRDGLSVGFTTTEYEFDADWILHVHAAELYEVSLCAVPAIADAGVTNVAAALAANRKEHPTMNRAQLAAALSAGTITQDQHDAALAAFTATEAAALASAPRTPAAAEVAAGPEMLTATPAASPGLAITDRQLSLREVTRRVSAAANTGDVHAVALALSDVIPANDAGEGYANRPEWLGELFTANQDRRPYIDAIGAPQPLNSLRAQGFRWGTTPKVEEYAGDKTAIASGPVTTVGDDFVSFRIAAGWDIDRAYIDFGSEQFLTDFWTRTLSDYQIKSETGIRTRVKALKANAAGSVTAGGVKAILKQVIHDGRAVTGAGVIVNRIFLSDSLFDELEDIPTRELPLWLQSAVIGMDIAAGTANVGQLMIDLDSTLAAGEVVGFDNRGLIVRERQIPQIRAIDIANGGIDLGFTSYLRLDDVDPRLVFRRKYTPPAAV